jgi:hypothetical protein
MLVAIPAVSGRLWPVARPEQGSLALPLLSIAGQVKGPTDIRSDHWINHPRAERYWIKEDSIRLKEGSVLSLLWWEDEKQLLDLDEYEEQRGNRRSDGRTDWE